MLSPQLIPEKKRAIQAGDEETDQMPSMILGDEGVEQDEEFEPEEI